MPSSARVTRPFTSSRTPPARLFTTRARASGVFTLSVVLSVCARARRVDVDAGSVCAPLRLSRAARLASPRALAARRVFFSPSSSSTASSSSFDRVARPRVVVVVLVVLVVRILARDVIVVVDDDGRLVVATRIARTERACDRRDRPSDRRDARSRARRGPSRPSPDVSNLSSSV
jgi:hypothetical protein